MNRTTAILAASILASTLSACGSNSLFSRDRPDEMMVSRQAPLVVPPDYSLTPPAPGAARPGGETTAEQTLRALFGGAAPRSTTESAIIGSADANRADPGIRSQVGSPTTEVVDKGLVTRDIIYSPEGDGQNAQAAIPGA